MPAISSTSSSRLATSPSVRSSASPSVHQGQDDLHELPSQLEKDFEKPPMPFSTPKEPCTEPQLLNSGHTSKSSTSFSATDTRLVRYTTNEEEGPSSTQAGSDILSDTRKEWLSDILSDARKEWLGQETARLRQEYEASVCHITAELEKKYQAQLRQTESDTIDKYTKALLERDTIHQSELEALRTNLNYDHKLELNQKSRNIRTNFEGVIAKKDNQLQKLTSELADARQSIKKLKKLTPRHHQDALEDMRAKLERDHSGQLHIKTRNIHTNYSGIIAKKDAQYHDLSKELGDTQQALGQLDDAYQAELTRTQQNHEEEKAQLKAEHGVTTQSLRESFENEIKLLKSHHATIVEKLQENYKDESQDDVDEKITKGSISEADESQDDVDEKITKGSISEADHSTILASLTTAHETELTQVRAMNEELVKLVAKIEDVCVKVRGLDLV